VGCGGQRCAGATWNDVVAHARGVARAIDDRDWLPALLHRLAG